MADTLADAMMMADATLMLKADANPILDTREYIVEFEDGCAV